MAKTKYELYCEYRKKKDVTDYEVSKQTGVATSTLAEWKKGRYTPKIPKLTAICEYLDIPLIDMINAPDPPKNG